VGVLLVVALLAFGFAPSTPRPPPEPSSNGGDGSGVGFISAIVPIVVIGRFWWLAGNDRFGWTHRRRSGGDPPAYS
jgi:hypothetical protein